MRYYVKLHVLLKKLYIQYKFPAVNDSENDTLHFIRIAATLHTLLGRSVTHLCWLLGAILGTFFPKTFVQRRIDFSLAGR